MASIDENGQKKGHIVGYVTKSNQFVPNSGILAGSGVGKAKSQQILDETGAESSSFTAFGPDKGLIVPPFDPGELVNLLEINTAHARSVLTKSTDAAGSGYALLPRSSKTNKSQKEKGERFFNNLRVPINVTLRKMFHDYETLGYGALELLRENDRADFPIVDIRHMPAHTVRVHRSWDKFAQKRGTKTVYFKNAESLTANGHFDVDAKTGQRYPYKKASAHTRGNEVLFFKKYHQKSDFYGVPDIIPALGAIMGDYERQEYNISFFQNFGVPAYAVFVTGDYDPGPLVDSTGQEDPNGKTELEWAIERHLAQLAANPHSTLILTVPSAVRKNGEPGKVEVTFQKLSDEVKEASFEKYRLANNREVLLAHGTESRISLEPDQQLSEEGDENYKRSRIDPMQAEVHIKITNIILRGELKIFDYNFALDELDTKDEEHDIETATGLFAMGMMTPNQGIAYFGKKFGIEPDHSIKELDYHYIGGAAVELGLSANPMSDQGQRPADEETAGMQGRGSRGGPAGQREQARRDLESNGSVTPRATEAVVSTVQSGRNGSGNA